MFVKYENESEILAVVRDFENGTISRADWRHPEHLTVALYYVFHHDYETALVKMRDGILNLLQAFAVDFSKKMPYHETLTVFWLRTVENYAKSRRAESLVNIGNELVSRFDKDYPLKFYSREFLFSDQARANYLEGDSNNRK